MRIALWNGSGLDNVGDRMLDWVNRVELGSRLPSTEFQSFCPWEDDKAVHPLRIDKEGHWSCEGQFDAIVIGGGSLLLGPPFQHPGFQTFCLGPYPMRFADRCKVIWNALCSDGQFLAPLFPKCRTYLQEAAQRIDLRSVRNARTRTFLEDSGVDLPIRVVPDPAVLLASPRTTPLRPTVSRIGVTVARPFFPQTFLHRMAEAARQGWDVANEEIVLAPSSGEGPLPTFDECAYVQKLAHILEPLSRQSTVEIAGIGRMYGDMEIARDVAARVPNVRLVEFHDRVGKDALEWARSLDCLVASRLHGSMLALLAGIPLIGVDLYLDEASGTSKLREFMAEVYDLKGYVTLSELLKDAACLSSVIDELCVRDGSLSDKHREFQRRATIHFDEVAEVIRSHR